MKKIIIWLKESNHYRHLIGGIGIGLCSDDLYCAAYAGIGIASALEFKDKTWGGEWDWADWGLTVAGVAIGYGIRLTLKSLI